jgi:hypothetical protein
VTETASSSRGSFNAVAAGSGLTIIKSPVRAPRANAIAERVVGTIRRELLDRILIVNERHAVKVLRVRRQSSGGGCGRSMIVAPDSRKCLMNR